MVRRRPYGELASEPAMAPPPLPSRGYNTNARRGGSGGTAKNSINENDVSSHQRYPPVVFESTGSIITLDSFFGDDVESGIPNSLRRQHQGGTEHNFTDSESFDIAEGIGDDDDDDYGDGITNTENVDDDAGFGVTFKNQDELPRLPIPNLEETANKLLQFLEALQTPEQKLTAQQCVLEFIKGDGPILQSLLRDYEQTGIEDGVLGSYLEEFWNESQIVPTTATTSVAAATSNHDPFSTRLNVNNPFFLLEDSPDPEFARHPIRRAASLTIAAMKVASTIRDETFLPDTFHEQPLCMDQYKAVFGAARVPQPMTDDLAGGGGDDDIDVYPNATHVVVLCRKQLYYFQALWPDTGILAVDEEDVVDILAAIDMNSRELSKEEAARTCPGVLTTLPRKEWAKMRQLLSTADERNAQYLTIIDSALFVLVLDDNMAPSSIHEAAANLLHGTCHLPEQPTEEKADSNETTFDQCSVFGTGRNRWYDKMQIIVCSDGTAGVNFEHSAIDSHTALRIVSDIYAETVVQFLQSITKTLPSNGKIPNIAQAPIERAGHQVTGGHTDRPSLDVLPKKITFEIPQAVERKMFHASILLGDEILSSDTQVLVFRNFGKKYVVSNSMSPDSLVQMSILLAYYKLYGKMVCAYEPVLTKAFFHGRTEAMRSATVPAKNLCEIFFDAKAQILSKLAMLKRALLVHRRLVRECSMGRGVDRHLFALKCMAERQGLPMPAFFDSEPWHMLNHTVLLAANCGNPSLRLFGVAPVVPDGFGIGYIIKDYSIHFCITSERRQTSRFMTALRSVLKELETLLQANSNTRTGQPLSIRLSDIIEEVPEGKVSTSDQGTNGEVGMHDMWGLRQPSNGYDEMLLTYPKSSLRGIYRPAIPVPSSAATAEGRWENEATIHHTAKNLTNHMAFAAGTSLMIPIAPLSDDETSDPSDSLPVRLPRRSRQRKSAPRIGADNNNNAINNSIHQPPSIPQRRGSYGGTRRRRRQELTMEQLNSSGEGFEFDMSGRSDPYLS